jgi:alanyl-tRNA synthetase
MRTTSPHGNAGHTAHWPVSRVRATFIEFFKSKPSAQAGHRFVPSSPCVPHDDPTLLFTNAGMNQFKPIFLGTVAPGSPLAGLKSAVNSQKCIRAGGKHNDLDDVGKDTYHHTFFEMLGNWSFGDYFKKEAVEWSFELLTKVYGVSADRLYATYFEGNPKLGLEPDEETRSLWRKFLPDDHILPGNMKDNFWEMGDSGPCGPCTEIHFDGRDDEARRAKSGRALVNTGDPEVIEIWNNVFIQFNREPDGTLKPLPAKHVDTGMGLERLTRVLNGKNSNYDTDVFFPIFAAIERLTGARPYTGRLGVHDAGNIDTAYRVIADHIRTLTFAITDGATPGNDGRGYVLRRILRRAVRYGRQVLSAKPGFFSALVPTVVENFGDAFPELKKNPQRVVEIIKDEEDSFGKTLDRGLKLFGEAADRAMVVRQAGGGHKDVAVVSGEDAFKLHDTYGFPIDLTMQMAEERGLKVDTAGYEKLMEQAKELARSGGKFAGEGDRLALTAETIARLEKLKVDKTDDADKYHGRRIRATVKAIWNGHNFDEHVRAGSQAHAVAVILDRTSMYSEMGGQECDTGRLTTLRESRAGEHRAGPGEFRVDGVRSFGGYVVHCGEMTRGELSVGDNVEVLVDTHRRAAIMANHTATHLLNFALREVLGDGVDQKGSLVAEDRLRFDFSHAKAVLPEELGRVEAGVKTWIDRAAPVDIQIAPLGAAKSVTGLRAVFGEVYPDPVRVVSVGASVADLLKNPGDARWRNASVEFCGGTHVQNTRDIHAFALVSEEAVAKGIRRITALTGVPAAAAIQAADALAARIRQASGLNGQALTDEVAQIQTEVDTLALPSVRKVELRAAIAGLQDRIKAESKKLSAAKEQQAVATARRIGQDSAARGEMVIVTTIDAGGDRAALQSAVNALVQACPRSAVMLMDVQEGEGKVAVIAAVPKAMIDHGLKAGDWVRVASEVLGGKGGGKPDMAQGGGTHVGKVKEAIALARQHALKAAGL